MSEQKHPTEDCYQHFLAYSGLDHSPIIQYAYYHGADVGMDRPPEIIRAAEVIQGTHAALSALSIRSGESRLQSDAAYWRGGDGVVYDTKAEADGAWCPAGVPSKPLYFREAKVARDAST